MNHPEKSPRHIVLIGMPACGKSTVGVLAAKTLGYRFIDSDLIIQEREGRRLHRIIREEGQAGFLAIEERVNLSLGNDSTPAVIATGGSAVYSEAAMVHFKSVGTVVYLRLSFETVQKRLGNFTHRGVVMPEGYTLRDLYDERCALYEKYADIIIDEAQTDRIGDVLNTLCSHFDGELT
ncbi:MAG: shikimate kinase [Clostridia bacterium]|nr:shikimate kinase [Clostridia bacterium]